MYQSNNSKNVLEIWGRLISDCIRVSAKIRSEESVERRLRCSVFWSKADIFFQKVISSGIDDGSIDAPSGAQKRQFTRCCRISSHE